MLLSVYAEEHGLIEKRSAKVLKVIPGKDSYTIHYRVEGQKYRDATDVSKRTLTKEEYGAQEVDDNGNLTTGSIVRKSNFLVWEPDSCEA